MKIAKNFTLALLFMAFAASYAADIENTVLYQVGTPGAIDANGTWSLSSGGEGLSDDLTVDYSIVNVDGTENSSLHIMDSMTLTGEEFAFYFEGDLDGEGHVGNIFTWDSDNGSIGDAVENAVNSGYLKAYLNGVFCESADFAIEGNSLGVALNVPEAAEFAAVLGVIGFAFVLRRRKK